MFVAPVTVGDGAYTAAGSVITEDVPPGALAVARAGSATSRAGWRAGGPGLLQRRRRPGRRAGQTGADGTGDDGGTAGGRRGEPTVTGIKAHAPRRT